ncbi:uncharacterized protein LOC142322123 isoform X2 [Lycorma delicatula]|uniref:uncharacterized protein LOC142322123 isoform X2 n=1 Tax=Lycorma delicatula TaxID=130591 RepID=UPI003F519FF9
MFSNKQIPQSIVDLKRSTRNLNYSEDQVILPLEVVSYIMEFLPYQDRISAGQVCQLWYEASIQAQFLNHEKVVFSKVSLEDDVTMALRIIDKSCRPFLHFVFIELELNSKMQKFWWKVGPEIKSLSLQNCEITGRMVIEILSNCKSLEFLEIKNCREPLISGKLLDDQSDVLTLRKSLMNVTNLSLSCNRYLSDALFNRFVSVMINLKALSLAGCQISFHPGLYKKFYPNRAVSGEPLFASETVLTFLNVIQFIQNFSDRLTCLDLSQTLVNSKSLLQIAELPNLHLKELYLQNCEQLTNAGVLSVTQYQCSLVVLDLSGCSRVTDQSFISICDRLSQLKKLRVCNCRAITDVGVVELYKLSNLEYLDISECEQVTGEGIETWLYFKKNKRLKWLHLRLLNKLSASSIIFLTENLTNLLHLDLSHCFYSVCDKTLQAVCKNLILLRSLKLANCGAITDAGLTGMQMEQCRVDTDIAKQIDEIKGTHYISLRSKAEEDIVRDARMKETVKLLCENSLNSEESYSLSCLKGLQELDLQSCNRITDVSLEYALKLKELQHLNLSRCQQITDIGLSFIAANNPSIHTLNLSYCHNISDNGIIILTNSLHRLKYIDLQGCKQLTNASLSAIKNNCPTLRYLDISHCNMVPDAVDMLPLTALHTLHVSSPAGILLGNKTRFGSWMNTG